MTTIRVKKDANYFAASNEPFNDERLSWEARGLMGYLLSKPNDWKVQQKDIMNKGAAGERKIRRMLAELRKAGYMNRIRVTLANNKFDWITEVYESPSQNPNPSSDVLKATRAFCTSAARTSAKLPDILSTELLSTELRERFATIAKELSAFQRGGLKSTDADLINTWLEKHTDEWILKAIKISKDNRATSASYTDKILIGWEAGGYPLSRDEQLARWRIEGRGDNRKKAESETAPAYKVYDPSSEPVKNYVPAPENLRRSHAAE